MTDQNESIIEVLDPDLEAQVMAQMLLMCDCGVARTADGQRLTRERFIEMCEEKVKQAS